MSGAPDRARWMSLWPLSGSGAIVVGLLAYLAYPTLTHLADSWQLHPDYSHGWLLLPATGWLLWSIRPWAVASTPMPGLGCVTMLSGGLLHLAAMVVPWPLLDYAGWVLLLRGVALCIWGREAAGRLMPALAFAILMFPLPTSWLNGLAMSLQNLIAYLAEIGLNLFWVCHRRGHLLYLAGLDEPLSVAVECSGVRQMLVFLSLAWFLAFFLNGAWWRKLLLVGAALPLAIVANVLRVLLLAIFARILGPDSIQGMLHDAPLLVTLPLGGMLLWWCYRWLENGAQVNITARQEPCLPESRDGFKFHWVVGILLLLVVSQLGLTKHLRMAEAAQPIAHVALDDLPIQLGPWRGQTHPEAEQVRKKADFADAVLVRTYVNKQSHAAAVYLVFSATGKDRLHHPEICLRDAGGALELKQARLTIPLQPNTPRVAERFRYQRERHERTVIYYWHYTLIPGDGEKQSLLQRIHRHQYDRWPGVTVQVQTNMTETQGWQAIETTLLPEIDRWLVEHLPSGAVEGISRLPVRWLH